MLLQRDKTETKIEINDVTDFGKVFLGELQIRIGEVVVLHGQFALRAQDNSNSIFKLNTQPIFSWKKLWLKSINLDSSLLLT